jgi:hypothetical protein
MTPLNLEQTLSYLRERMPAPFDLPQLAHLCRQGKLTPLFAYNDFAMDYHEYLETRAEGLDFSLLGYVTNQKLISVIESNNPLHISIATVYECTNSTSDYLTNETRQELKGRIVFLLAKQFNYSQYQNDENYTVFSNKDGVTITRNDLLFDLEQLESIAPAGDTQTSQRKNALAHSATDTTAHTPADMVKVPHQSYRTIDRILYALIQLSGADNSEPYSQNNPSLNAKITTILQNDGLPLEYEAVGKWLARANDLKPINKK